MGFFTFIESFFFLSLGITFVLIFLMVFHFKQRVEQLEKKNEIVLEAYNDIVKQINILNTVCISSNPYQPSNFTTQNLSENITFSTSSPIPIPIYNTPPTNTPPYPKIKVEDFEEEEDEEDEEDDDEEDEDEEDDFELQSEELFSNEENVDQENTSLEMEEIEIKTEEVVVQEEVKIEEEEKEVVQEEKVSVVPEELETEDTEDDIKKMNVQQLRNLVTIKGLSNDASKIKRPELIRLLTANKPATNTASLHDLSLLL